MKDVRQSEEKSLMQKLTELTRNGRAASAF
jgi:hypothetical protein